MLFETDQAADLRKLDKLNQWLFTSMCGLDPDAIDEAAAAGEGAPPNPSLPRPSAPLLARRARARCTRRVSGRRPRASKRGSA